MKPPIQTDNRLNEAQDPFTRMKKLVYLDDARMPFHGISHPNNVWESALEIVGRCKRHSIPVDERSLKTSIDLHDAFMHIDPRLLGFRNAEELAGRFTFNLLKSLGASDREAQKVERITLATHHLTPLTTVEEKVIRAADLADLAGKYQTFCQRTLALHRETENRTGVAQPPDLWTARSFQFLGNYLWPMIELTPAARDGVGRSVWHTKTCGNLGRFWRENVAPRGDIVVELIYHDRPLLPSEGKPHFYFGVHPKESVREDHFHWIPITLPNKSVAVIVPGGEHALPFPDNFCDDIILPSLSLEGVKEASRILRRGGKLLFQLPNHLGGRPPESGPTPPGFVFEEFIQKESKRFAAFVKDTIM